jgi:hypothetical protein
MTQNGITFIHSEDISEQVNTFYATTKKIKFYAHAEKLFTCSLHPFFRWPARIFSRTYLDNRRFLGKKGLFLVNK